MKWSSSKQSLTPFEGEKIGLSNTIFNNKMDANICSKFRQPDFTSLLNRAEYVCRFSALLSWQRSFSSSRLWSGLHGPPPDWGAPCWPSSASPGCRTQRPGWPRRPYGTWFRCLKSVLFKWNFLFLSALKTNLLWTCVLRLAYGVPMRTVR